MRKFLLKISFALVFSVSSLMSFSQIVISQVYGGGGNAGADYTHDFVELFNAGDEAVNINGWSIQYASAAGTSWSNHSVLPDSTLLPGQYFLIQQSQGTGGTTPLPTPDFVPPSLITMGAINLKILLANDAVIVSGENPTDANIVDKVGFGSATGFEGTVAPALSNTTAGFRLIGGCQDTNDNGADFIAAAPNPRNSASPLHVCSEIPEETVVTVSTENDVPAVINTLGGSLQLVASITPIETSQEVTWSITAGNAFASIDANGLVTAIADGTVTVVATSVADATASDEIDVVITNQTIAVVSVTASVTDGLPAQINTDGGTLQLEAVVFPSEANQEVVWSVSNGNLFATVDANGLVSALSNGTATLRATSAEDENIFDDIDVVISNQTIAVTSVVVTTQSGGAAEILVEDGTLQLVATANPVGASQQVVWSVQSGGSVASVNQSGLVTALSVGTATIRATSASNNTIYGELVVEVDYEIIGIEEDLNATMIQLYPNPTNGIINLKGVQELTSVSIYNVLGCLVYTTTTQSQINLSPFENGFYVVKVKTAQGKESIINVLKQ